MGILRTGMMRLPRQARVLGRVHLVGRLDDVEQMVGNETPLAGRRFRAADVEPAVDLDRIEVDDLATDGPREPDCQVGLPGTGRTGDDDQRLRRRSVQCRVRVMCDRSSSSERISRRWARQ